MKHASDCEQPTTVLGLVWKHLKNWQSVYLMLPSAIFSIWLIGKVAKLISGREPQENIDWLVGNFGNVMKLVCLIIFCEAVRQQTGNWWKPVELIEHPHLGWQQALTKCVTLIVGAYLLSH